MSLRAIFLAMLASLPCLAAELVFPPDARIVNVRDFGAKGDGKADDTFAIRRAIQRGLDWRVNVRYVAPAFVYFPRGTYLVSGPIESRVADSGWSGGWLGGMILVGESREASVIRLLAHHPRYQDPSLPLHVVAASGEGGGVTKPGEWSFWGGNQSFRQYVINLTVSTGKGNPGAIGIDYITSNRGALEDVTVRSEDGQGVAGIEMTRTWPGPGMIKRCAVEGFDYGVRIGQAQYSMTFEDLELSGQKKAGFCNNGNVVSVRRLSSRNTVPGLVNANPGGHVTLLDSRFSGGGHGAAAIENGGSLVVKNLTVADYGKAIDDLTSADRDVPVEGGNGVTALYLSGRTFTVGDVATPFTLPVVETPEFASTNLEQWASATAFGAIRDDGRDDADAIQAAIDSGKSVVYLPCGLYHVSRPIVIRGAVRKLTGLVSSIEPLGTNANPLLRFEGGASGPVVLEHLRVAGWLEHASKGTLALRHVDLGGYRNVAAGTGSLFLEDVICGPLQIAHRQSVWARQLNQEHNPGPMAENRGGQLWIFGLKTELPATLIKTVGGWTELLGALVYPLSGTGVPEFINEDGAVSLCYSVNGNAYEENMRETMGGQTAVLRASDIGEHRTVLYNSSPARPAISAGVPATATVAAKTPAGQGWRLTFYDSADCTRRLSSDDVTAIDCGFGGVPMRTNARPFMTVYQGIFTPPVTGTYTFSAGGQDWAFRVRLVIGGTLVIDSVRAPERRPDQGGSIRLQAGQPLPFRFEVLREGGVWAQFVWKFLPEKGIKGPKQEAAVLIPAEFFKPDSREIPVVRLEASGYRIFENGPGAVVKVTREGGLERPASFDVWARGSALDRGLCAMPTNRVAFAPGQRVVEFTVTPIDNSEPGGLSEVWIGMGGHPDYLVTAEHLHFALVDDETPIEGTGTGLEGRYSAVDGPPGLITDPEMTGGAPALLKTDWSKLRPAGRRVDPCIDFDWTAAPPLVSMSYRASFEAQWTGTIQPRYSETYTFRVESAPAARLWVDHDLVVDLSKGDYMGRRDGRIELKAGTRYDIKLHTRFAGYGAVRLLWSSPSQSEERIPACQLYPDGYTGSKRQELEEMVMDAIMDAPSPLGIDPLGKDRADELEQVGLGELDVTQ